MSATKTGELIDLVKSEQDHSGLVKEDTPSGTVYEFVVDQLPDELKVGDKVEFILVKTPVTSIEIAAGLRKKV